MDHSFDDSYSPPPEELNIRMPEMSALIVNENSNINDSNNFNFDDIFGTKTPKQESQNLNQRNNETNSTNFEKINSIEKTEILMSDR